MTPRTRLTAALNLPADADGPAVRAAVLRRLPAEDFVPPEDWATAVNAAAGAALPVTEAAAATEATAVRREVEAFAADYWSLTVAERRARWADLSARCDGGPAAAFLRHLADGLDVEATPHPDPVVEAVAGVVRELFVIPPRPRAVRRAEWLATRAGSAEKQSSLERLRADAPAIVALEPALFDQAVVGPDTDFVSIAASMDRAAFTTVVTPPLSAGWSAAKGGERRREAVEAFKQAMETTRRKKRVASGELGWGSRWPVLLAIIMVGGLLRGLATSSRDHSPPPRSTPSYQWPPPSNPPIRQTFTREELERFKRYDPKSGEPRPAGYDEWNQYLDETLGGYGRGLKPPEYRKFDPPRPGTRPTFR